MKPKNLIRNSLTSLEKSKHERYKKQFQDKKYELFKTWQLINSALPPKSLKLAAKLTDSETMVMRQLTII